MHTHLSQDIKNLINTKQNHKTLRIIDFEKS